MRNLEYTCDHCHRTVRETPDSDTGVSAWTFIIRESRWTADLNQNHDGPHICTKCINRLKVLSIDKWKTYE